MRLALAILLLLASSASSYAQGTVLPPAVDNTISLQTADNITVPVANAWTSNIPAGMFVSAVEATNQTSLLGVVPAMFPTDINVIGITAQHLDQGETGRIYAYGRHVGINNYGYPSGTIIYLADGINNGIDGKNWTASDTTRIRVGYVEQEATSASSSNGALRVAAVNADLSLEDDPKWAAVSNLYYLKTQIDILLAAKAQSNLVWSTFAKASDVATTVANLNAADQSLSNTVSSLSGDLAAEAAARIAADEALAGDLAAAVSNIADNASAILAEASTRIASDAALSNGVAGVASGLSTEQAARAGADAALSNALSAVASTASSNASAISSETSARTAADASLSNAVSTLTSNLSSEQTARRAADAALSNKVLAIEADYLVSSDIAAMATTDQVAAVEALIPDVSSFATTDQVAAVEALIPDVSSFATTDEVAAVQGLIPDVSSYATTDQVAAVEALIPDITNLATTDQVAAATANAQTPITGSTSGRLTIDLGAKPLHAFLQVGAITNIALSYDTNKVTFAEVLLYANGSAITWPTNNVTWKPYLPDAASNKWQSILFRSHRGKVQAAYVGSYD